MSIAKKRTNRNHDEIGRMTTRGWTKSGLSSVLRRARRLARKAGNRYEAALHWASFDYVDEPEVDLFAPPAAFAADSFCDLFEPEHIFVFHDDARDDVHDLFVEDDFDYLDCDDRFHDRQDRFEYLYGDL